MGRSSALALAVLGLLAACGTCIPEASALEAAHGAASLDGALDAYASRDLLKKKRRKKKKTKKVKKTKKNVSQSFAQNVNEEGVLINQQTTASIDGNNNAVVGGFTSPVTNAVFKFGVDDEDDNNRKLLSVRRDGSARDLLKKRKRKSKKVKKVKKKKVKKAESIAVNSNESGVLINQQTSAYIEGDGNAVVGPATSPVFNAVLKFGDDEDDNNRKLLSIRGGGGGDWSARDLLKKKRKKKKVKKVKKVKKKKAQNIAGNSNVEGVLINQQDAVNIEGDGNGYLGSETSPVFNANVDIGDILLD